VSWAAGFCVKKTTFPCSVVGESINGWWGGGGLMLEECVKHLNCFMHCFGVGLIPIAGSRFVLPLVGWVNFAGEGGGLGSAGENASNGG